MHCVYWREEYLPSVRAPVRRNPGGREPGNEDSTQPGARGVRCVIPDLREGSPFGCLAHLRTYCC